MRARHRYIRLFLISWFCLLNYISPAHGHVLSGPHLLDLMTANSGRADRIQVWQTLFIYDDDPLSEPAAWKETLRYRFPDAFRSDTDGASVKRIHIVVGNSALTVIDGRITGSTESQFDHYKDIMLNPSRKSLGDRLSALGVDIGTTSLGRFQEKVVYVLGAQYPDFPPPQLWIERRDFRPVRWLLKRERAGEDVGRKEIRYLNWQRIQGTWYPLEVEFYEKERLVRKIRVDRVKINPSIPENLFDVGRLRAMYPAAVTEPVAPEGIGDVPKTIETFRKRYE